MLLDERIFVVTISQAFIVALTLIFAFVVVRINILATPPVPAIAELIKTLAL